MHVLEDCLHWSACRVCKYNDFLICWVTANIVAWLIYISLPSSELWGSVTIMGDTEQIVLGEQIAINNFSHFLFFFFFSFLHKSSINRLWLKLCAEAEQFLPLCLSWSLLRIYDWLRSGSFAYTHMLCVLFLFHHWLAGDLRVMSSGKTALKPNSKSVCWLMQLYFAV